MGCGCSIFGRKSPAVAPADGELCVYVANQHTTLFQEKFAALITPNAKIKASMPPFNIIEGIAIPANIAQFKVPVFGPNILNGIMSIFLSPVTATGFQDLAKEMGIRMPQYALDGFLQKKVPKVKILLDVARNRPDCAEGPNADAITKCEQWVDAFHNLNSDSIANLAGWHSFVEQYVPKGWQQKLHFDVVLSNFGFEDETAKELAQHPYDDEGKATNLQHYCLRWLAKSFAGFGPVGCLTDVANLVFAMQHDTPPNQVTEPDVVACMQGFKERLESGNFDRLWIPDLLAIDCELDDMLCWLLVEYIYRRTKRRAALKVLIQLPEDSALDLDAERLGKLGGTVVFRDSGSRNAEAVKQNFGVK